MTKKASDYVQQLFKPGAVAGFDHGFVRRLMDGYASAHAERAQELQYGITSSPSGEDRAEQLAAFLSFAAGIADMLHSMMVRLPPAQNAEDQARAALLLLYGNERGMWPLTDQLARQARHLVRRHPQFEELRKPWNFAKEETMTKPSTTKTGRDLAIMRACTELECAVRDGNPAQKLQAIENWLQTVACLAPEALRVALAKIVPGKKHAQ